MPLIPYFLDGEATPSRFNDITVIKPPPDKNKKPQRRCCCDDDEDEKDYKDPFKVSTNHGGRIMPEYVEALPFSSFHVGLDCSPLALIVLFHKSETLKVAIIPRTYLAIL